MKTTAIFGKFFKSERSGGVLLILATILSLSVSNSGAGEAYMGFWHFPLFNATLGHWINDGLMTLFFLLVGLELEREIFIGELSEPKKALLPVLAAIGGMLVPAAFHLGFNAGTPTQSGFGIPMATDIAFSLAVLSLFSRRVPYALKIFLTALAIADDLGAILVIAIFYSDGISWIYLGAALGIFGTLFLLGKLKVYSFLPYIIGGIAMWLCMLNSGVHATITGVLLAFAIPFGKGGEKSLSHRFQQALHIPVSFIVLPVFALANTCILLQPGWHLQLLEPNGLGILTGLLIGKPVGILLFCLLAVKLGISKLPEMLSWKHIAGAGMLAGIGFTMSIFVALLAFEGEMSSISQVTVLVASLVAAFTGALWFRFFVPRNKA